MAPDAPASVSDSVQVTGGGDANTHLVAGVTNVQPSPNLEIAKSHSPAFYQGLVGGQYRITVSNGGPGPTTSEVTVMDNLPSGLTATSIQGQGWNCSGLSGPCNRSDVLAAGDTYPPITLTVNVSPTAPATVTNMATVSGGGDENTHTAMDPTNIQLSPNLQIQKFHSPAFFQGLVGGQYMISVYNGGPGPTTAEVNVTDNLPSGLTATSILGQGWNCSAPSGPCNRSDALNAGSSYPPIVVTVNVSPTAPASVTNTAVLSGGGDMNTHTATDPTPIQASPNLQIEKSHSPAFSQGLTGGQYMISVYNGGPGPTTAPVMVADNLPSGLTATSMQGQGWNCTSLSGPCTRSDALNAGTSYPPIILTVNVAANAPGQVTNTATLSGGGDATNHTATDPTPIAQTHPTLAISKTHSGNFTQGQTDAVYSMTVSNNGTGPTNGTVTAMDNVPSGLTATSIGGNGWNCTQPAGPCTRSDVLVAGSSYPVFELSASVSVNAPSTITNTATVSGGGDPPATWPAIQPRSRRLCRLYRLPRRTPGHSRRAKPAPCTPSWSATMDRDRPAARSP